MRVEQREFDMLQEFDTILSYPTSPERVGAEGYMLGIVPKQSDQRITHTSYRGTHYPKQP